MTHTPLSSADWDLVQRYLLGQATPAEEETARGLIARDAGMRSLVGVLRMTAPAQEAPLVDVVALKSRIDARRRGESLGVDRSMPLTGAGIRRFGGILLSLRRPDQETAGMAGGATVKKLFRTWPRRDPGQHSLFRTVGFGVAAGAVFLVAFVAIMTRGRHHATVAAVAEPATREYATVRGQRATVQLLDGTWVTLAAESRIRVPATFGNGTREVFLDGEAVFNVVHDTARPFRVHIRREVIEDIGTRFDVRAYAEDSLVHVAVEEGMVAMGRMYAPSAIAQAKAAEGVIVRRGERGTIDQAGRVTVTAVPNIERYFAWSKGRLEFSHTPLPEVVGAIGHWYDLNVETDASLQGRVITVSFALEAPMDMIHILALTLNAHAERNGRTVRLTANQP